MSTGSACLLGAGLLLAEFLQPRREPFAARYGVAAGTLDRVGLAAERAFARQAFDKKFRRFRVALAAPVFQPHMRRRVLGIVS